MTVKRYLGTFVYNPQFIFLQSLQYSGGRRAYGSATTRDG